MKTTTLSLMLILPASACESKAQIGIPAAMPQFIILLGDVVSTSIKIISLDLNTSLPIKELPVLNSVLTREKAAELVNLAISI